MPMWMGAICTATKAESLKMQLFWYQLRSMRTNHCEILGEAGGMKEGKARWVSFFQQSHGRGLNCVKLIVSDKHLGMLKAVGEAFPEAKYQ